jgi:predicted Fe-Mo cluster-binding NifX family protein
MGSRILMSLAQQIHSILEVEKRVIKCRSVENPASSYDMEPDQLFLRMLIDSKVNIVIATEFGPGASELPEHHKIALMLFVEANRRC